MNATAAEPAPSKSHLRTLISIVMIVVAVLLAPIAAVGTWTRLQLVDTDRFVSTFAPLADDPGVQNFIADQITDQIDQQVDFKQLLDPVFAELAAANLPPRASAAVASLQAPAVAGMQSIVATTTQRLVASDQFADLWATSLRVSHRQATAILKGQSGKALTLSDDGTLSVQLTPLIDAVKDRLRARGLTFVDRIPAQDRAITIVKIDSLGLAKMSYQIAAIGGLWLPWLAAALLLGGVLVANRRRRAMVIASVVLAVVFALMTIGVWIGGNVFVLSLSPDPLPSGVASTVFGQITAAMDSTLRALTFLGVLIAVVGWFAGPARPARATRAVLDSGFTSLRGALDRNGGDTGTFGRFLDRNRNVILTVAVILGMLALIAARPVTLSTIGWLVVVLAVVAVGIEVLRRSAQAPVAEPPADPAPAEPEDAATA